MDDFVYITDLNDGFNHLANFEAAVRESGEDKPIIAYDIETSGLDARTERMLFAQLYHRSYPAIILDVRKLGYGPTRALLYKVLTRGEWVKVGHNLKFDMSFTRQHLKIDLANPYDTYLAESLLRAGLKEDLSLKDLASRYLGLYMNKDLRSDFLTLGETRPSPELLTYMAEDVRVLPGIRTKQVEMLRKLGLVEVARLEFALIPVLVDAELRGIRVDRNRWEAHVASLQEEADKIAEELQKDLQPYIDRYRNKKYAASQAEYLEVYADYANLASQREAGARAYKQTLLDGGMPKGDAQKAMNEWKREHPLPQRPSAPKLGEGPINLGSPQQLQGALGEMGIQLPAKANGQMETDRFALQWQAAEWPILARVLEYRALSKLVTAFGEAVIRFLDEKSRLHPEYRQLVDTGRMACSKPNIQQVPANKLGAEFRHCFVAPEGYKIISCDYSQIELRILFELAGQEDTIAAINSGLDLHSLTTANMFGYNYDYVKEHYEKNVELKIKRRAAKVINFGVAYGLSPQGLSRNEKIPLREAKKYIRTWEQANPRVVEWLRATKQKGLSLGYAETLLGRKRFFAPLSSYPEEEQARMRGRFERQIGNHPIQGTSADITKMAAVRIYKALRKGGYDAHIIMFVHDEIVVEAREDQADKVARLVQEEMVEAAEHFLKKVKVEVGLSGPSDHWEH